MSVNQGLRFYGGGGGGGGGTGTVESVNGDPGPDVVLDATDVGADAAGAASTVQGLALLKAQNLADVPNAGTARGNLGLGTAATHAHSDYLLATGVGLPFTFTVALSDETTAITTGTAKVTFRIPFAFTLTGIQADVNTAGSGATVIDLNEAGTTVLSTKVTIDASAKTSVGAATPPVISDSSIAANAELTADIDTAGSGAKGLKLTLIGVRA